MKDQLEIAALLVGVTAPIMGGLWFLWKQRQSSIQNNFTTLAQNWTNEVDLYNRESMYLLMKLRLTGGELIGSIILSESGREFYVYARPGWFYSKIEVIDGNRPLKGIVQVRISGNRNRLKWKAKGVASTFPLLKSTVLWVTDYNPES